MKTEALKVGNELKAMIDGLEYNTDVIERLQQLKGVRLCAVYREGQTFIEVPITHLDLIAVLETEIRHNDYVLHGLKKQLEEL